MWRWAGITAMVPLSIVLGCIPSGTRQPQKAGALDDPIVVDVTNENWNTVIVYAVAHGQTIRLGDVGTGQGARLRVPVAASPTTGDFGLRVETIGPQSSFDTGNITVNRGDRVMLDVANDLGMSMFATRSRGG